MGNKNTYKVIGLMSGSSLDGLDIVYVEINSGEKFSFDIIAAETIPYDQQVKSFFRTIDRSKNNFEEENIYFGTVCAQAVNSFIQKNKIAGVDFISSHGHTIFHHPEEGITCQIGDGKTISELTGITVVNNFRQADVDAGGQGAPLVPVCDEYFFSDYHACLNIGGIANISFRLNDQRIGFDICAANQLLNFSASQLNLEFDKDGEIAKSGVVNFDLLELLNAHPWYSIPFPKSLDNNFVLIEFIQLISSYGISIADQLATATMHIAIQIAAVIQSQIKKSGIEPEEYKILITGGGAHNSYLISLIESLAGIEVELSNNLLIDFKEALAMALMAVLRMENRPNFLPTVTGASLAVSGGDIHLHS